MQRQGCALIPWILQIIIEICQGFAGITQPLMELMKKNVKWQWGPSEQTAFYTLKDALCNAPLLVYPDPPLPYSV